MNDYLGLLIAIGFGLASVMALRASLQWRRGALAAHGRVVDFVRSDGPGRSTQGSRHYPIIAFETEHGEEVRFESNVRALDHFTLGDGVPVFYHAEHPEGARIGKLRYVHFWALVLATLAFMVGGVWVAQVYGF